MADAATDQGEVGYERHGRVSLLEFRRPPHNFFDVALLQTLNARLDRLAEERDCRAVVLAAAGRSFCAGADLKPDQSAGGTERRVGELYEEAKRLYRFPKPLIAAVQGPAIGGGLGVALACDFRIACPEARFSANFTKLGFHPGFGLTATLPRLVGAQKAALLCLTSRRVNGQEAVALGLADSLVPRDQLRAAALALAAEIAEAAPLAVAATRDSLRQDLLPAVEAAIDRELQEQVRLRETADFKEGVRAMKARETPNFIGA